MPGARRSSQLSDLWRSIFAAASPESTTRPVTDRPLAAEVELGRLPRLEVERHGLAGGERRFPADRELGPHASLHRRDAREDESAVAVGLHREILLDVGRPGPSRRSGSKVIQTSGTGLPAWSSRPSILAQAFSVSSPGCWSGSPVQSA